MKPGLPKSNGARIARRAPELFATLWTRTTLHARHGGRARTGPAPQLSGISMKMLSQTLRELAASGLVTRQVQDSVPPAVEYALSPLGELMVQPVYDWARANAAALDALKPQATSKRH